MEENEKIFKDEIVPTSYRATLEDDVLEKLIGAGWFEANWIEETTERQTHEYVAK